MIQGKNEKVAGVGGEEGNITFIYFCFKPSQSVELGSSGQSSQVQLIVFATGQYEHAVFC